MPVGMINFFLRIYFILICIVFSGCKGYDFKPHKNVKVKFLSEYILPDNVFVNNMLVGGLSGIDFYNGTYYLVCDDSNDPRFYCGTIDVTNDKISSINIDSVVLINANSKFLDLEAIRYDTHKNQIVLTSEGHIKLQKDPLFFSVDSTGSIQNIFQIPDAFTPGSIQKPRHNGTLEGLCISFNKNGYWLAMELPLEADGSEPQFSPTKSPVRITYINSKTKRPEKQFAYFLDAVAKKAVGNFSVNGLTDLIQYDKNTFLVIERSYSSGLGSQGNTIKLFMVDASKTTNTLNIDSLKNADFVAARKELLLNFEDLRDQLTNHSIDNIEGITFGPLLPNGNKSLILISDNNFNKLEKQLNQFILLELDPN